MKKILVLAALAISLVGVLAAGNALAATTDVDVTATVSEACIAITTTDITIGAIDPTTATGVISSASHPGSTSGQINVKCTAGTDVIFSTLGTATLTGAVNNDTMDIVPIVPAGAATPGITGSNYAVNASIAYSEYSAASADVYTGVFTVTVTP